MYEKPWKNNAFNDFGRNMYEKHWKNNDFEGRWPPVAAGRRPSRSLFFQCFSYMFLPKSLKALFFQGFSYITLPKTLTSVVFQLFFVYFPSKIVKHRCFSNVLHTFSLQNR
jgi:hypothetical protein